uniref:Uncharacterized protein n=1 Tax=Monopterus albus TaxID=43700 RepID=A0A3Q3RAQ3_MONAL
HLSSPLVDRLIQKRDTQLDTAISKTRIKIGEAFEQWGVVDLSTSPPTYTIHMVVCSFLFILS